MKWSLKRHCSERDYILFLLGIHTGLRISELLSLKVKDIKGKTEATMKEGRKKKPRIIPLDEVCQEVAAYIDTIDGVWLFPSRKGDKPISKIQAYRQLKKAAEMVDIESVGTHTMRKTFGYWFYERTKDLAALQEILNHSHPEATLKYIGIPNGEQSSFNDYVL
ncbi:tyrosine-type recombinase/integrase [Peribacillus sp. SI8-4]|uniref:tyrosine-type recombinase/integrase n=1 Tax=Peribacillus sp. SI8-4 TaxID=3048009 RepID=UPI002557355D|nr:tyrosine-type recombinase/integrase [Peribacillus sp. SI8-4]